MLPVEHNDPTNEKTLSFSCRWAARFFPESSESSAESTFTCRPINPPWMLESELGVLLPALAEALAGAPAKGGTRIGWLTGEK